MKKKVSNVSSHIKKNMGSRFCDNINECTRLLKETICGTEVKKKEEKLCYPMLLYNFFIGTWICKSFMPNSTYINCPISNQPPYVN